MIVDVRKKQGLVAPAFNIRLYICLFVPCLLNFLQLNLFL